MENDLSRVVDSTTRLPEEALQESERFRLIIDGLPAFVTLMRPDGELERANQHVLDYFGEPIEALKARPSGDTIHPDERADVLAAWQRSIGVGSAYEFEARQRRADGVYRWFEMRGFPLRQADGQIALWYLLQTDIDDRKRAEALLTGEKQLLEMVASGHPMPAVLSALCRFVENTVEGCYCSVVLIDPTGRHLQHGAAPSLPPSFVDAIIGRRVNAESGPCAMAIHLNEAISAADLATETRWKEGGWCALALGCGLRACISTPVSSAAGNVIGALAVYFDTPSKQADLDQSIVDQCTNIASIVIERAQNDAALKRSDALLAGEKQLLEMVASGCSLTEALEELCLVVEGLAGDCTCSVVLVDASGTELRQGASPSLPPEFMASVDGRPVSVETGPCATATYLNEQVISADVKTETRWHAYGWPTLALSFGLQAVWSTPISSRQGKVIGSFALHFHEPATPSAYHQALIERFTHLASIIIERAQSDEALKRSEESFREIVETTPECVKIIAHDGTLLRVNSAGVVMAGADGPDEIIGLCFYDFLAPEDRDRYRMFNERVCSGSGERDFLEFDIISKQGMRRQVETHAAPMRRQDGSIVQLGVTRDITARKQAQEKLRRSEAYLTEAQKLSLTGSFGWSVSSDEHFWSAETFRIFEYDPAVTVTLPLILDRVYPEDVPMLQQAIERAAAGHDLEHEFRLLMPDGRVKHIHCVGHGIEGTNGQLEYVGAVQDVTERRLSEEALGKARSELAHVARVASLSALTASIAHEVNQPLSGIVTNASCCLRMLAADPPNISGALETARRTIRDGNRASDVIKRLRALFGKKSVTAEWVDLNEAVQGVIALASADLQRNRVLLRQDLAAGLPPVLGDRIQLQQVVLNLLLNASDAMRDIDRPRQAMIRTLLGEEGDVRLTVEDVGIGFDPEAGDRLFEAFYTTKRDGMGIGLSVSRNIVESHQGRLWAERNDGPGATFAFSIPSRPAQMVDAPGPAARFAKSV